MSTVRIRATRRVEALLPGCLCVRAIAAGSCTPAAWVARVVCCLHGPCRETCPAAVSPGRGPPVCARQRVAANSVQVQISRPEPVRPPATLPPFVATCNNWRECGNKEMDLASVLSFRRGMSYFHNKPLRMRICTAHNPVKIEKRTTDSGSARRVFERLTSVLSVFFWQRCHHGATNGSCYSAGLFSRTSQCRSRFSVSRYLSCWPRQPSTAVQHSDALA